MSDAVSREKFEKTKNKYKIIHNNYENLQVEYEHELNKNDDLVEEIEELVSDCKELRLENNDLDKQLKQESLARLNMTNLNSSLQKKYEKLKNMFEHTQHELENALEENNRLKDNLRKSVKKCKELKQTIMINTQISNRDKNM